MKASETEAGSIAPGCPWISTSLYQGGDQHAVFVNAMECTGQMVYVCLYLDNAVCR